MMRPKILALDLGTVTGVCYGSSPEKLEAYPLVLATKKEMLAARKIRDDRRRDPRIIRFQEHLEALHEREKFDLVVFEDVLFSSYTAATQLWASLRSVVWLTFPAPTTIDCINTSSLKKFATGYGGAKKQEMVQAAIKALGNGFKKKTLDHNVADAISLWFWGHHLFISDLAS